MINTIKYPEKSAWASLTSRSKNDQSDIQCLVKKIVEDVQTLGDKALRKYTYKYDGIKLADLLVDATCLSQSQLLVSEKLKAAIQLAKDNIYKFHKAYIEKSTKVETTDGVFCWRENRAIQKVGLYIPGGSAPLFSTVLMLGIPALLAGCNDIVICTPPNDKGEIDPLILYTASLLGIDKVYKVGGAQAIAAMAFGTKSMEKVDKIFGPGNQFVTMAKMIVQSLGVAIDMPAGPSELLVIADSKCNPKYVASDLLSQLEHGPDSQVILLSNNLAIIDSIVKELNVQKSILPRKDIVEKSITNSRCILLKDLESCIQFSNCYCPEHLILAIENSDAYGSKITNAGSVFFGNYSCESIGDYASGTNHTLPTNGFANSYSGLSVDSFLKKITFQKVTKRGLLNIGPSVEIMAEAEQLIAHKQAVSLRLNDLKNE